MELKREIFEKLCAPLLENHAINTLEHRRKLGSWPSRSIFSDLCKPMVCKDKKTGKEELILICIVPPTPNFWSAWISLYVLFGDKDFFGTHAKACRTLLHHVNVTKHHVKNLTDNFLVLQFLQRSAEGLAINKYLENPVLCMANIWNECFIAQNAKKEEDLGKPDQALLFKIQKEYNECKSNWKRRENNSKERILLLEDPNDRQGERID